jgi:hypothetical protein
MAVRKPLVIVAGQVQQLQAGDTIESSPVLQDRTNNNAGTIVICTPVYADADDDVDEAQADAEATSAVIGLVFDSTILTTATGSIIMSGIHTATTGEWDAVTGDSGGLVVDDLYYLDAAAPGMLTSTAPTTTTEFVVPVGIALSATDMKLVDRHSVLL